jgi:hypothetical protein
MTKTFHALSWKNPQLLAFFLMTSLSLLRGEHYTYILTFLTQILMGVLLVIFGRAHVFIWLLVMMC